MTKTGKRIALIVVVFFIADILLFYLYGELVKARFAAETPAKADCAIVLFGDFCDDFCLGDETIRRCHHALRLFVNSRISSIVCSGGNRPGKGKSGAVMMRRWFSEHGVPDKALYSESASCDSLSNLEDSMELVRSLGIYSVLVVSSPMHLYRLDSLLSAKTEFYGMDVRLEPYSYGNARPELGPHLLFLQTHYEWISLFIFRWFPRGLYDEIIYLLRGCRPTRRVS